MCREHIALPPDPETHCPHRRSEATLPSPHFLASYPLLGQFSGLGFVRAKSGQSLSRVVLQEAHQLAPSDTRTKGSVPKQIHFLLGSYRKPLASGAADLVLSTKYPLPEPGPQTWRWPPWTLQPGQAAPSPRVRRSPRGDPEPSGQRCDPRASQAFLVLVAKTLCSLCARASDLTE